MSFLDFLFGRTREFHNEVTTPYNGDIPDPDDNEELQRHREDAERRVQRLRELNAEYSFDQYQRGQRKKH